MKNKMVRALALLVVGALLGSITLAVTPAGAQVAQKLTISKIKKKLDKRYVKKTDATAFVKKTDVSKYTRVASVSTNTGVGANVDTQAMSVPITAPTTGFLIINGHGVMSGSGSPLAHCGLVIDGVNTYAGDDSRSASVNIPSLPGACDWTVTVPVAAGAHTVAYNLHNDGGGSLTFRGGSLTAQFVPFNGVGAPPVLVKPTPGRGDVNR